MREILFRGKRIDNGEWVEGGLISVACCGKPATYSIMPTTPTSCNYSVIPETVGQYTGLTDKNGNKIFEGDILSAYFDDLFPDSESILVVGNNGFAFTLKCRDCEPEIIDNTDIPYFKDNFEVIGNIHDNPELLKGE